MKNIIKGLPLLVVTSALTLGVLNVMVITTPKTDKCIVIHGDIDDRMTISVEEQYAKLVNKVDVCIDIETNGGLVRSAVDIILFLEKNTKTRTMIVERYAHSAGVFIMLSGTHLKMSPNAISVIHTPRIGYSNGALVIDPEFNEAFNRVFLTLGRGNQVLQNRVGEYLNGKDVWMTGAEIVYNLHDLQYAQFTNRNYTYLDNIKFMLTY